MDLLRKLRRQLFPRLSREVLCGMDKEALRGIYYSSLAVFIAEVASSALYLVTRERVTANIMESVVSALMCCVLCLAGHLVSKRMMNCTMCNHQKIILFKILYFVLLSLWGIFESARSYAAGNQMITFFGVEFLMAAFLIIKPWLSTLLMGGTYTTLFIVVMVIDGAKHLDKFNFLALTLISIAGMIVRFHVQRDATQRAVTLQYVSTHDELTRLRNRKGLDQDLQKISGHDLVVRMLDVNYFKEINDEYGHLTGDIVLKTAATHLERIFPGGRIYRFGGDEFLILSDKMDPTGFPGDTYGFDIEKDGQNIGITLSIGHVMGTPHNRDELFTLIGWADHELYDVKARTHGSRR